MPSSPGLAEPRTTASGRAGILALFVLLVGWKAYSLASGNFRIQEAWSGWQYALAFLQDVFVFVLFAVTWDLWLSKRGRAGLAVTIVVAFLLCLFQCVDARMKVRFLHPLSTQWIRYAFDEAATIGPDSTVFTGGAYWRLALASFALLGLAFAAPWIRGLRALASFLALLDHLRLVARGALVPLAIGAFLVPAQPYGLHRNFVLATLLPIDKPVVGYDHAETRASEAPSVRSSAASCAHVDHPALASCRGRNVVLYVIESLAREQTSLGSRGEDTTPVLARMLAEGGVETPCYAQFANSAKATFGLLSGVYAAQTMEVLECEMTSMSGLPRALADAGYFSVCLTPQFLYYQGQRTMFQKLGFRELCAFLDLRELARARGTPFAETGPASRDDRLMFMWDHARLTARQPFFATYYTMSSHYPYLFPGQTKGSEEERHERAVRYTDQVLGELLEDYRRRGIADNTLFVITADHGEDFKDGRFALRHSSLAQDAHEVPLVFFAPGVDLSHWKLGRARQVDLLPTILDLVGLAPEGLALSGESLLLGERERPVFLSSYGTEPTRALVDGSRKWIWDVESDVRWSIDLASDPRGAHPVRVDAESPAEARAAADSAVERMRDFAIYNEAFLRDVVAGRVSVTAPSAQGR
ncbi:MAG TPA: LTA synthase family protein [Planctomycetota bacterium]|nr:LTA synthase family protein [Planctomycetota bacterium]